MTVQQLIDHLTEELQEVRAEKDKLMSSSYKIRQVSSIVADTARLEWCLGRESALKETLILVKKNMVE